MGLGLELGCVVLNVWLVIPHSWEITKGRAKPFPGRPPSRLSHGQTHSMRTARDEEPKTPTFTCVPMTSRGNLGLKGHCSPLPSHTTMPKLETNDRLSHPRLRVFYRLIPSPGPLCDPQSQASRGVPLTHEVVDQLTSPKRSPCQTNGATSPESHEIKILKNLDSSIPLQRIEPPPPFPPIHNP